VRSRKRKATEPEQRRQGGSRGFDGQSGAAAGNDQGRQQVFDRVFKVGFQAKQREGTRVYGGSSFNRVIGGSSNIMGGRLASAEWHGSGSLAVDGILGSKASYYVSNFPDNIPLFRLRQAFEVCGILADVYVARYRNARGQEYGFVRYVNVKNREKLLHALNNVRIGDCCVRAREARFDRFAHNDVVAASSSKVVVRKEGGVARLGGSFLGEGFKSVRKGGVPVVGKKVEEGIQVLREDPMKEIRSGEESLNVGLVRKSKARRVEEVVKGEAVGAVVGKVGVVEKTNVKVGVVGFRREESLKGGKLVSTPTFSFRHIDKPNLKFTPVYKSCDADRRWASSGVVASVIAGDLTLAAQQRVEEAGFANVVVTPIGGDKVFLTCCGGEDVWQVINEAVDFFSMIFSNLHRWSSSKVRYERGAWLRVYGVPVHAWNEAFFKLCVVGIGRFIQADDCMVDKA